MYEGMTIHDLLDISISRYPGKTAIVYKERRLSYSELGKRINRLANNLIEMGVRKGDRVGLYFYNCSDFIEAFFAAQRAGAVVVPVNFRLHPHEVKWVMDKTKCGTLIYSERFSETVDAVKGDLGTVERMVHSDELERLCRDGDEKRPGVELKQDDWASFMFTGGTTGEPKAAIYSQRSYLWQCLIMMLSTKAHSEDIYLNHPPLFHLAGMGQTLAVLAAGGTVIVVDTWNPTEILGLVESERVNFLYLVPPQLYRMITDHPDIKNFDVGTVKKLVTSAGGNSSAIVRSLYDTFPNLKLCLYGWGQTETASGTVNELTAAMVEEEPEKTQSVGREIFFTEIRLVDKDGAEVPVGEMGEAVVRTPSSFVGYLDRPELTREILQDGWVHTGDIFEKDSEGFFYLRDRKKDMIKCGGENVFAQEVEATLLTHPSVDTCAIIGVPSTRYGEGILAVVKTIEGMAVSEEEVIQYCKDRLASYKKPQAVVFVDDFPLNSLGKIQKFKLREELKNVQLD